MNEDVIITLITLYCMADDFINTVMYGHRVVNYPPVGKVIMARWEEKQGIIKAAELSMLIPFCSYICKSGRR